MKASAPGTRFERRYQRRRAEGSGKLSRFLSPVLGVLLVLAGIVGLVLPGPGLIWIALGLTLMAQESLALARSLDRLELRLRGTWARVAAWWIRRGT